MDLTIFPSSAEAIKSISGIRRKIKRTRREMVVLCSACGGGLVLIVRDKGKGERMQSAECKMQNAELGKRDKGKGDSQ